MSVRKLDLAVEYYQWKLSEMLLRDLKDELCGRGESKCQYEIHNMLERFLLCISNIPGDDWGNNWSTMFWPITNRTKCVRKLISELYDKKHLFEETDLSMESIKKLVDVEIVKKIRKFLSFKKPNRTGLVAEKITFGRGMLKFMGETLEINPNNLDVLKKHKQHDLKLLFMRYKAHLAGGQQWGIPINVYRNLYDNYGVRYEGFGSPLNSRFMSREGTRFCSLFQDVDAPFGSLGTFLDINMLNPLRKKVTPKKIAWVVNPPYIEKIMNQTIKKILQSARLAKKHGVELVVYGSLPYWSDSEAYQLLEKSPEVAYLEVLNPRQHFYESNKPIVSQFKSVVYVIDSLGKASQARRRAYSMAFMPMKIGSGGLQIKN